MTNETKALPTADVLGVVTGRLLGNIGGIYQVLDWMTGESVYTHQIPRICGEAAPVLLALHPQLAEAVIESERVNRDNAREWLATWTARYGEAIAVPKLSADQHERIDPVSELVEKIHPDNIIIVRRP